MKHGRVANKRIKQMMHDLGLDETENSDAMLRDQQNDDNDNQPFESENNER
ncbi:hypothetical protein [Thaumasiovibrio subtropicus]|uniref:hypothetical protein n=1 Tax=Thaumasiovibrio subtropicus TaxID=1891207 RepID=UPI001863CC5B|nr:hypothetical protein [Thaumasiovibrio subtropicus]